MLNTQSGPSASVSAGMANSFPSAREQLALALADEARLRASLAQADIVPQLLLSCHLSGRSELLDEAKPFITGGWSYQETIPDPLRARIRDSLVETLQACATNPAMLVPPDPSSFRTTLSAGVGTAVPADYAEFMLEETFEEGVDGRRVDWRGEVPQAALAGFKVIVIGAGLAGLCMALKLRQAGIQFVVFEKNDAVGGTWYENSYPGAGVDIPNHFYSFAFEPKHDWSHHFAKRDELWGYLDEIADKWDVRRHIRFRTEVTRAVYDDKACSWSVTTRAADGSTETLEAKIVVTAVGQLNRPSIPAIPGLNGFSGPVFHTAEWDHSQDLTGRRVALVGTGASSMQVGPAIAEKVTKLLIFQRSPSWAAKNPNYHLAVNSGMKWALANIPYFAKWYRYLLFWTCGDLLHASLQVDPQWPTPERSLNAVNDRMRNDLLAHIKSEIGDDPVLLKKVIPDYPPYGKRMLRDNNWYKMLKRSNVELIDTAIARVEPDALVDSAGQRHEADVIVLATGFQASRMLFPMEISGRDGLSLRELWGEDDPRAHLGITVPGFPNLFIVYGPNTNLSHGGSLFFHAELQVRYIMQGLREMLEGGYQAMECRGEPHDAYNRQVDEAHGRMVWTHRGMRNWYRNSAGRVVANSPWRLIDYWRLTAELKTSDFQFTPEHDGRGSTPPVRTPELLAGQFINGLVSGAMYALVAIGFTLVIGVLDKLNFAHPEVLMLGGFVGVVSLSSLPLPWAFAAALVVGGVMGLVTELVAFRRFTGQDAKITAALSSMAVGLIVTDVVQKVWGTEAVTLPPLTGWISHRFKIAGVEFLNVQFVIVGVTIALAGGLQLLLARSRAGRQIRAVAESSLSASLLGIDVRRVTQAVFFISSALAAEAGLLLALRSGAASSDIGLTFGLKALAIMAIGGLGDLRGAAVGGLVIGVLEALMFVFGLGRLSELTVWAAMILVLIVRPSGIFGSITKVEQRA